MLSTKVRAYVVHGVLSNRYNDVHPRFDLVPVGKIDQLVEIGAMMSRNKMGRERDSELWHTRML